MHCHQPPRRIPYEFQVFKGVIRKILLLCRTDYWKFLSWNNVLVRGNEMDWRILVLIKNAYLLWFVEQITIKKNEKIIYYFIGYSWGLIYLVVNIIRTEKDCKKKSGKYTILLNENRAVVCFPPWYHRCIRPRYSFAFNPGAMRVLANWRRGRIWFLIPFQITYFQKILIKKPFKRYKKWRNTRSTWYLFPNASLTI